VRPEDIYDGTWRYDLGGPLTVTHEVVSGAVKVTFGGHDGTRWPPVWIRLFPGPDPGEVDLSSSGTGPS